MVVAVDGGRLMTRRRGMRVGRRFCLQARRIILAVATAGTFARASVATRETSTGVVQEFAINVRKAVPRGVHYGAAHTSQMTRSHQLDVGWTSEGTVNADSAVDPKGDTEADNFAGGGSAPDRVFIATAAPETSGNILSAWLKSDTTLEAHIRLAAGVGRFTAGEDLDITPAWARYQVAQGGTNSGPSVVLLPAHTSGADDNTVATSDDMDVAMVQVEHNAAGYPRSYVETNGSATSCAVDNHEIPVVDIPAEVLTGDFAFDCWPDFDSTSSFAAMLLYSEHVSGSDQIVLRSGTPTVGIVERAGAEKTVGLAFVQDDRITVEVRRSSETLTILVNGVSQGSVALVDGLGHTFTQPMGIGSRDGASPFDGVISDFWAL